MYGPLPNLTRIPILSIFHTNIVQLVLLLSSLPTDLEPKG
jgi:hypothetical protein